MFIKKLNIYRLGGILFLVGILAGCTEKSKTPLSLIKAKQELYAQLNATVSGKIADRVATMPEKYIRALQKYDLSIGASGAENYKQYNPTDADKNLVAEYIALLPDGYQKILQKKLLRIYFIENFSGGGMTDWVVDNNGNVLYYLVFNSSVLNRQINDWLTFKSNSIFEEDARQKIKINIDGGYQALLYVLLHEGSHIVDYELAITPYMDQGNKEYLARTGEETEYTKNIWASQNDPKQQYKIAEEKNLNFYRSFSSVPYVNGSKIIGYYLKLKESPFVTIYSTKAWYEDFADLATYYHISEKLGSTITVEVEEDSKRILIFNPMKSKLVKLRLGIMEQFYK